MITTAGTVDVTLYFDNVMMTGIDQVFYVNLVHTNPETGVNVETTPSTITLEAIGGYILIRFHQYCINTNHVLWL